jgi:hypothetical protein
MNLQHVARYFKDDDFSDVDVELILVHAPSDAVGRRQNLSSRQAAAEDQLLARFPAHRLVLAGTDYFKAQVRRLAVICCSQAADASQICTAHRRSTSV